MSIDSIVYSIILHIRYQEEYSFLLSPTALGKLERAKQKAGRNDLRCPPRRNWRGRENFPGGIFFWAGKGNGSIERGFSTCRGITPHLPPPHTQRWRKSSVVWTLMQPHTTVARSYREKKGKKVCVCVCVSPPGVCFSTHTHNPARRR